MSRMIVELGAETADVRVIATGYLAPAGAGGVPVLHRPRPLADAARAGAGLPAQCLTSRNCLSVFLDGCASEFRDHSLFSFACDIISPSLLESVERGEGNGAEGEHRPGGRYRRVDATETVSFGLDGTTYEIDLNDKNAAALRDALSGYVGHARKVGSASRRGPQVQHASAAPAAPAPARSVTGPAPTATRSPTAAGSRPTSAPRSSRPLTQRVAAGGSSWARVRVELGLVSLNGAQLNTDFGPARRRCVR